MTVTDLAIDPTAARAASDDHPLIAHLSAYLAAGRPAWRYAGAVAVTYHYWEHPSVTVTGPSDDVAALVTTIGPAVDSWASIPADAAALLPDGFLRDRHTWAFRWSTAPTGTPADAASWLGPGDEDDVHALLAEAFPDASVQPGSPKARRWAGIRDDRGRLVACAADATGSESVGFVASITTRPQLRGRGLGRRVTGWLLDRLVETHGRAALWVHGDNEPAVAAYDRLGMRELVMTAGALPAAHHRLDTDIADAPTERAVD